MKGRRAVDVPVELFWARGKPIVTLRELPAGWVSTRFWDETLAQAVGRPRLLPLDHAADPSGTWRPSGSIFHLQRCGSTLACRLLGALPGVMALSEPMIFQSLLSGPGSTEERQVWLRRLMTLHQTSLCAADAALVIKWSSVVVAHEAEIAAAFPGVPAVFMHRDPIEVLASCLDGPPIGVRRLNPNFLPPHLRLTEAEIQSGPLAEVLVRYHASCCHHARQSQSMRLLDYRALPGAVWERLTHFFGIRAPAGRTLDAMKAQARIDAKDPAGSRVFAPDGRRKQAGSSAEMRALVARFVEPELEALRARHPAL